MAANNKKRVVGPLSQIVADYVTAETAKWTPDEGAVAFYQDILRASRADPNDSNAVCTRMKVSTTGLSKINTFLNEEDNVVGCLKLLARALTCAVFTQAVALGEHVDVYELSVTSMHDCSFVMVHYRRPAPTTVVARAEPDGPSVTELSDKETDK